MPEPPQNVSSPRPLQRAPLPTLAVPLADTRPPVVEAVAISQVAKSLRRHARLILAIAGGVFVLAAAVTLLSHMTFASSARIYLGELENAGHAPPAPGGGELDLTGGGHGDIGSEVEILKSRSIVTQAILESGLNATVLPAGSGQPRYWQWLLSGRSERLLDVTSREIAAVDADLTDHARGSATIRVLFTSQVDYQVTRRGLPAGEGRLGEKVTADGVTLRLVPGSERGPLAGSSYDIVVRSLTDVAFASLKALDVSTPSNKAAPSGETVKVANLRFVDRSPLKAASFLEHLMAKYLAERQSWKTENASAAESFVTTELGKTRDTLDDLQSKLAAYRSKNGVVVLDNEAKEIISQIGTYEQQRVAARVEVQSLSTVNEQLRGPAPPVEAFMLGEAKDDSVLISLATALTQSEQKLTDLETRYNAPAPEVQNQRAQVQAQLQAIRKYVNTRLQRARDTLRMLDGVVGEYEQKLKTVPGAEVGLAQLTRESEVYSALYSQLLRRQQETALVKASTISKDRVLDPPDVPYREESPRLGFLLATLPLGLILGGLVVVVRSVTSGRLQPGEDVRKHMGNVPIFAMIPHVPRGGERLSPPCVEAFRTLRTNLQSVCGQSQGNIVVLTSPTTGDGKTTCAYLLASTMARSGRSVLLVDAGLRRESRFEPQGTVGGKGLADVLTRREGWRDVLREITVGSGGRFQAISGGGDASTDLLSSGAMFEFVADARRAFDFVLIEAPSYPAVSDTHVLAAMADCTLSIVRVEHTTRAVAVESVRQLAASVPNCGIIVNDVV